MKTTAIVCFAAVYCFPSLPDVTVSALRDPRFGDDVLAELQRRGHNYDLPPGESVLWPFAEPNGIISDGRNDPENVGWKSGLSPFAKPAHAAGY